MPITLIGPKFIPLRPEIQHYADQKPYWRETPKRAIISMGGSDIANQTPTVVRSFEGLDIDVDVIIGPGFTKANERDTRSAAENINSNVSVIRNPVNLAERMYHSDFAICTASTTTYELLSLGIPIICQPVSGNQQPIATALQERNLAITVSRNCEENEYREAINRYLKKPCIRKTRCIRGRQLIDRFGSARISAIIQSMIENMTG